MALRPEPVLSRPQVKSDIFVSLLFWPSLILSATGLLSLDSYNLLPSRTVLSLALFIGALLSFRAITLSTLLTLLVIAAYLVTRLGTPAAEGAVAFDAALQANQWLLYLASLCLLVGVEITNIRRLNLMVRVLIFAAACKYSISFLLVSGATQRPGLLDENNYELALYAGLLAVTYRWQGKFRLYLVFALGLVTALSGSRSGSVAYLVLLVFVLFARLAQSKRERVAIGGTILAAGLAAFWIFTSRSPTDGPVDRVDFLNVFLSEVSDWTPLTWLFGTPPVTPLSHGACSSLSFYSALYADPHDGVCYVVILHVFVLRVLFDSGLVGLCAAFGGIALVLRLARVRGSLALCLVAIALSNSLSVSGVNNVFVMIPVALSVVTARFASFGGTLGVLDRLSDGTPVSPNHPSRYAT